MCFRSPACDDVVCPFASWQDATGFVEHTLVKVPYDGRAVFFRVTAVDAKSNSVSVRLERFTLFWQQTDIMISPGERCSRRFIDCMLESMKLVVLLRCGKPASPASLLGKSMARLL